MGKKKWKWEDIRREYIEALSVSARPTLKELSEKYGISFSYIQQKCRQQGWRDEAENFIRKIAVERQGSITTIVVAEQTQFDSDCLRLCSAAITQVGQYLETAALTNKVLKLHELDLLTRALERLQRIGKLAIGGDCEASSATSGFEWARLTATDVQLRKDGDKAD